MRSVTKRVISLVLLAAMLFSYTNLAWAAEAGGSQNTSEGEKITDGSIIAGYYDFINDREKAILACDALVGDGYEITYPDDQDDLVAVDTENKTVTAENYVDGELVWKPVSASVIYKNDDGTEAQPVEFELTNGQGSFTCPADSYRIAVDYELWITVDGSLQKCLVDAPSVLVDGVIDFKRLDNLKSSLGSTTTKIFDGLYMLITYGFITSASPDYAAIVDMHDYERENGNSILYNMIVECGGSASVVRYLLENGEALRAENERVVNNFEIVTDDNSDVRRLIAEVQANPTDPTDPNYNFLYGLQQVQDAANNAQLGLAVLENCLYGGMYDVMDDEWNIIGYTGVASDASEDEMRELDAAVENGIQTVNKRFNSLVNEHADFVADSDLLAASTTVYAGVDQYKVNVRAEAAVIDRYSVDTNETVVLPDVKEITLVLDKGTSDEDILARIEESGIKAEAVAAWDTFYNISEEHYSVTVSGVPEALEGDVDVTLTYVPADVTVTYNYETTEQINVKYGYNLLLAPHSDPTKSYDYTVNGELVREDTVIRITEATDISRKEDKATEKVRVPVAVANSYTYSDSLSAAEKAVLSSFALVDDYVWYRTPTKDQELVKVTVGDSARSFNVQAESYASGQLSGAVWTAVEGKVIASNGSVIMTFPVENKIGAFECAEDFDHVQIVYEARLDDIGAESAEKWLNLPNALTSELAQQKLSLEKLNAYYNQLGKIDSSVMSVIETFADKGNYSDEAKDAIADINNNCFNGANVLYVYEYLTNYRASGISYYYEYGVAENMYSQIKLLSDSLETIWADEAFQADLEGNPTLSANKTLLLQVREVLNGALGRAENEENNAPLVGINELVNTRSEYLPSLIAETENATGSTTEHTATDIPVMRTEINAVAPDKSIINITVQVVNGKGDTVGIPEAESRSFTIGKVLTEDDIAELEAIIASLEGRITVDRDHYVRTAVGNMPAVGDVLYGNTVDLVYTWSPKAYNVIVEGVPGVQTFYADSTFAVILPACGEANCVWRYTVGDNTYDVGSSEYTYRFAGFEELEALFDENGYLTVTRELVDKYKEEIVSFAASLNKAVADNGLVFEKDGILCLKAAFIVLEDQESGEYTMVLRISPEGFEDDLGGLVESLGNIFLRGYFKYIAIGNVTFWDGTVSAQALIDMLLGSELGFDELCRVIYENGELAEITEDIPALAEYTAVGDIGGAVEVNGKYINNTDLLGAKLVTTQLSFGMSENDEGMKNVPLYITVEDFDTSADELASFRAGIDELRKTVNINCKDNSLAITLNMSDQAFAVYMAILILTGNAKISDIDGISLEAAMDYTANALKDLINDPDFTLATVERTLALAGISGVDLSGYGDMFESTVRPILKAMAEKAAADGEDSSEVSKTYADVLNINIRDVLINDLGLDEALLRLINEADADSDGLAVRYSVCVENLDTGYDALIIDPSADSLANAAYLTRDLAASIAGAGEGAVVIILSDTQLTEKIVLDRALTVDLNGKTLKGDIEASIDGDGKVHIIDTNIGTFNCGTLDGTLTGDITVTKGRFTCNVDGMLSAGYEQENGYVRNKYFTVAQNEAGEIDILLTPDFLGIADDGGIKEFAATLAAEFAADAIVNICSIASLSVNGKELYSFSVDDLIGYMNAEDALQTLANDLIGAINTDTLEWFINAIVCDITDFGAAKDAVNSSAPLASYDFSAANWDVYMSLSGEADNNTVKLDIAPAGDKTVRRVNIKVDDSADASAKRELAELFECLDNAVISSDISFTLSPLTIDNGSLAAQLKGDISMSMDLSRDKDYAVIIATALAYNATGSYRTELVNAVSTYVEKGSTRLIKLAVEKATIAQLVTAVKSLSGTSFANMLEAIGVDCGSAVALESTYDKLIVIGARILGLLGINGSATKLGSVKTTEFGQYSFEKNDQQSWNIHVLIKLFTDDKYVVVKNEAGKFVYQTDDMTEALLNVSNGDKVYVNNKVILADDVNIAAKIEIFGVSNITINSKKIYLTDPSARIVSDASLNGVVEVGLEGYELDVTEVGSKYVYALHAVIILSDIEVVSVTGEIKEYASGDLALALENAVAGDVVKINNSGVLVRDAEVSAAITVNGASKISVGSYKIYLTNGVACVTADADMTSSAFVSGADGYEMQITVAGGKYTYKLVGITPVISQPIIYRTSTGIVRGSRVDSTNKYIFVDVRPKGMTVEVAVTKRYIDFTATGAHTKTVKISRNGRTLESDEIVATGDVVTVTAVNTAANKTATVSYTVIIMGDTNCNGIIDSGDCFLVSRHYVGKQELTGVKLLAADVNQNNKIDAGDAVKNATKYTYKWENNSYDSALG